MHILPYRPFPSNRKLTKLYEQIDSTPFDLRKVSGRWVATTEQGREYTYTRLGWLQLQERK